MKRSDLIISREYWIADIQLKLFNLIEHYRQKYNLTKTQIAEKLGFTKSYVTQVLNGDFDHKMSKLVDLSLAFGKVPVLNFVDVDVFLQDEITHGTHPNPARTKPIQFNTFITVQSSQESLKQFTGGIPMIIEETPFATN